MTPLQSPAELGALHAAPRLPAAAGDARRAAEEFEAVFLGQMMAHMFAGLGEDPLTGGGQAGELYRSMLHDEYGKAVSRAGGIGIADAVMREIVKLQERGQR